jgi:hypothetical protein
MWKYKKENEIEKTHEKNRDKLEKTFTEIEEIFK